MTSNCQTRVASPAEHPSANFVSCSAPVNLGFLTVLHEPNGFFGGYLATNSWGRPLEFRLSTAVQPSRVQQILYGPTLRPYICADLIGKTLVERTAICVQIVVTDCRSVLELRRLIETPLVWLAVPADRSSPSLTLSGPETPGLNGVDLSLDSAIADLPAISLAAGNVFCHPQFATDKPLVRGLIERLTETLDLAEPFGRIREAIGEARKMGVTKCA